MGKLSGFFHRLCVFAVENLLCLKVFPKWKIWFQLSWMKCTSASGSSYGQKFLWKFLLKFLLVTPGVGRDSARCCGKREKAGALYSILAPAWVSPAFSLALKNSAFRDHQLSKSCLHRKYDLFLDQGQKISCSQFQSSPKSSLLCKDEPFFLWEVFTQTHRINLDAWGPPQARGILMPLIKETTILRKTNNQLPLFMMLPPKVVVLYNSCRYARD